MRLCIVGSRSLKSMRLEKLEALLQEHLPNGFEVTEVISGGAVGIDALAEQYADAHGITKTIIRPDYARYGKRAPLVRNDEMLNMADFVLLIWDGESHGSSYVESYVQTHAIYGHAVYLTEDELQEK